MSGRSLRRGNWSVQELERLRHLLPRRGVEDAAILLRRSPASVYRKAMEIMRVAPRRGPWSAADDELLRDAWGALELRLLGVILGRPMAQVEARADELRRDVRSGPWQAAERQRLKEFFGSRSDADLEVCLQRVQGDIVEMARQLCLAKDKRFAATERRQQGDAGRARMPRWSEAEIRSLRESYPDRDNLEIAQQLGRTVASVANKANQLGLKKSPDVLAEIGRANVRARYRRAVDAPERDPPDSSQPERSQPEGGRPPERRSAEGQSAEGQSAESQSAESQSEESQSE